MPFFIPCFETIRTAERGIITRLGKFDRVAEPGLNVLFYPFDVLAGTVSMRLHQLAVTTQTKTKDNVTVGVTVSVQFKVTEANVAFYSLENVRSQITAHVDDTVRSSMPLLTLDEAFESKDTVTSELEMALRSSLEVYGYDIVRVLLVDLQLPAAIMNAMNEINTQKRLKLAAEEKAEANKVLCVTRATADAEVAYLQGTGIARMRQAILDAMADSFDGWKEVPEVSEKEVMQFILTTNQVELLKTVATMPNTSVILDFKRGKGSVPGVSNPIPVAAPNSMPEQLQMA